MTAPLVQAGPMAPPPVASDRTRLTTRHWGLLLIAGWLCQAALRAWFSRGQALPLANPDESAYLITARMLAGGPTADFSYGTLYPAGYPLLISPVFWFTHNPHTAYQSVLVVNALISALLMPLGYFAGRRLGLNRPLAYAVAMITALLPAGFFYSEYALTDAIYPVIVLAWLLTTHTWLTARSFRGRMGAAAGSALLAGYADAVHSRGLVIIGCYVLFCVFIAIRRFVPRDTVVVAVFSLAVMAIASWAANLHVAQALYPNGARSLSGQAKQRLHSVHGIVSDLEMALGQIWRLTLDSWGVAAIGLIVAIVVAIGRYPQFLNQVPGALPRVFGELRYRVPRDLRLVAALSALVAIVIAVTAPAALPADQPTAWASGRYLDGFITLYFIVGAAVLLRCSRRQILASAVLVIPPLLVAGIAVDAYAGPSVPTRGFSASFNFAEPAVLTQNWISANVALATGVALALLALWVGVALFAAPRWRPVILIGLAAVSIAATAQMTVTVSRASTPLQQVNMLTGLEADDQIAISKDLGWQVWVPQAYEIWWTRLEFFRPSRQGPPANASVVEVPYPASGPVQSSWPQAPAGWHVAQWSVAGGWVTWRNQP